MSILALWFGSQLPRFYNFLQSLPTGFFIVFGSSFLLATLIGKGIGILVSRNVDLDKKFKKTQRTKTSKTAMTTKPTAADSHDHHSNAGIASPEELKAFVDKAGDKLLVVDTRTTDFASEPGDETSLKLAGLPTGAFRTKAKNLVWDRANQTMPELPADVAKDTPIITHCGAGTRGGLAKEFLEQHGFTNVINGGGPKQKECWAVYGDK
ncbi:hypothetical protein MPSEU_000128000 [Mayamaea pseudoterrestris]|nr:hypothetical protein MPSEU_000128000 [Mayamaea pseudoterrestris]